MKNENNITSETALYVLIFLAAMMVRLIHLGRVPLLESEASWAIQAWQLAQGESIPISLQVGYLSITEGLFALFGGSEFLARFWPAFAGSLLIWLPFFFREDIKRIPALVLAGGLALDPALVPVSRISGSPMPALVLLLLAAGAFHIKRIPWALFLLGLSLFSGPGFWMGSLILGITFLVCRWLGFFQPREYIKIRMDHFSGKPEDWLPRIAPALLGLVMIGSFFFRDFQGLGAWAGSLFGFFRTWGDPSGFGIGSFIVYFLLNNPLIIIFGLLGFANAYRTGDRLGKAISIWFGVALIGCLIYPHRQAADQIWLVIPLWVATGTELIRFFQLAPSTWITRILAGLVVVLASLNWLTFTGMIYQGANPNAFRLGLGLLAASLALLILSGTIVTSEWGRKMAWKGLVTGFAVVLSLYLVSSLALDAFLVEKDPRSMFSGESGSGQMELLLDSIADASITATGRPDSLKGAVIGDSDVVRWTLREYEDIDYLINPGSGEDYPFLITIGEGDYQSLSDNFRGQDFVLSSGPGWDRILPDDWISWIAFREGPVDREYLVLWVRNDIYSGY